LKRVFRINASVIGGVLAILIAVVWFVAGFAAGRIFFCRRSRGDRLTRSSKTVNGSGQILSGTASQGTLTIRSHHAFRDDIDLGGEGPQFHEGRRGRAGSVRAARRGYQRRWRRRPAPSDGAKYAQVRRSVPRRNGQDLCPTFTQMIRSTTPPRQNNHPQVL
jgi:hypothetical protein